MENITSITEKSSIESLPADSSWWKFFVTMYFGRNYFCFGGRASRKEYWGTFILFKLFYYLIAFVLALSVINGFCSEKTADFILNGVFLYYIIPVLAQMSRRFHDINMRAWWGLLIIPLFFLPFFKGDQKDNRFGKNIYGAA